jgi:hypothetical protein
MVHFSLVQRQTHYCRVEGNDRCVVQIRVEFEGIPYADTFAVEIRWVATRDGEGDIKVEVGVEVDFKKSTFLKGKIRSGTMEETAGVHRNLFNAVQVACAATNGVEPADSVIESVGKVTCNEIEAARTEGIRLLDRRIFDSHVLTACFMLVLVAFLWRSFSRGAVSHSTLGEDSFTSTMSTNEMAAFGAKIERLEAEMAMVRETLSEILSLVQSKPEHCSNSN